MCFVSVFALSLTLHSLAVAYQMQHNLVPNVGLEVKAEIKVMNWSNMN